VEDGESIKTVLKMGLYSNRLVAATCANTVIVTWSPKPTPAAGAPWCAEGRKWMDPFGQTTDRGTHGFESLVLSVEEPSCGRFVLPAFQAVASDSQP
jgi:hypothetical protein